MLGKPKYAEAARSYFLTYYKDVDDDPLEYKDDSAASRDETRHIILHQWENDKIQKYIRYRVLNIPLVYAYVKSRPEQVFTEEELAIVENVKIRVSETGFSTEEADFLRRVKETLVKELERRNRMSKG